ncbi:hypothetical protein [Streptomyces xinghaiensis]|nr:hypothetical protein [Streptomyces xinghaiensis]
MEVHDLDRGSSGRACHHQGFVAYAEELLLDRRNVEGALLGVM